MSKRWSITSRLTCHYTLTTVCLLVVVTVCLYWILNALVFRAEKQFIANEVYLLKGLLEKNSVPSDVLKHEVIETPELLQNQVFRYYVRILDKNNRVLLQTPRMDTLASREKFGDEGHTRWHSSYHYWKKEDGHTYLLVSRPVQGKNNSQRLIQIALDVTYSHQIIKAYSIRMIIAVILCGLVASILGYGVARRGLTPLRQLMDTMEEITVNELHAHIDSATWPKEFSSLSVALNTMLERIKTSYDRLSQCTTELAHELRTPINNLMGEAELALTRERTTRDYRDVLESSLEEFRRLSTMVENILFLARIENPKTGLQKKEINVHQEIKAIYEFYEPLATEKKITLICEGEAKLKVDPLLFRRAIINLLVNAIQHTPKEGKICCEITQEKTGVKISVKDNGVGISSEHLPHIFQRFYRVGTEGSKSLVGVGLGLAIVKSIVDLHSGCIDIESRINVGTSVIVHFPAFSFL